MTDLTRKKDYNEKKTISAMSARVTHDQVADTALNELFNLPADALIRLAGVVVHTAGDAGLTVDFGFAGGAELGNDIPLDATGYFDADAVSTVTTLTGTVTALTLTEGTPNTLDSGTVAITSGAGTVAAAPRILTTTGKNVTAKFSADPTEGDFTFIVEVLEFELGNGKLMDYSA